MYDYFKKDLNDERFFAEYIGSRLPREIVDAHLHVNLLAHVAPVSPQTVANDWALQCGLVMPYEDAVAYHTALLPGRRLRMLAFPWLLPEADIPANNAYLADLMKTHGIGALMATRPEWSAEYVESQLLKYGFSGFKPYPYMAAAEKGAEVSIFDFLPRTHLAVADRHKKAVLLHLPRKGRLAAGGNIREIRDIVQRYPNLRLVLADYGRCFTPKFLREGLDKLGSDCGNVWFDTAAVINPDVHGEALQCLDASQILYGTDMPILLWHGRRRWDGNRRISTSAGRISRGTLTNARKRKRSTRFFSTSSLKPCLTRWNVPAARPGPPEPYSTAMP